MKEININLNKSLIPVKFGNVELKFDMSDKGIELVDMKMQQLAEQIQKVSNEDAQNFVKVAFDITYGKGSYDILYAECPSNLFLMEAYIEAGQAIREYAESIEKKVNPRGKYGKKK